MLDLDLERQFYAQACRRSLWAYGLHAWGLLYNPRTRAWLDESVQRPMVEWFQFHALEWLDWRRRGIIRQKRLAAVVPREFAKTTWLTQIGQSWLHLLDPDLSTYTGSESTTNASEFLASIGAVISGSDPYAKFTALYGNWQHPDRKFTAREIVHAMRRTTSRKEPSFGIWGVEKGLTRLHPDGGFFDDPTSYEAMGTDSNWLGVVNNHWDSLIPTFTADSLLVLPGTRYGDGDHFAHVFKSDGIATLTGMQDDDYAPHPGQSPGLEWHVFFLQGRDKQGRPTYPRKWPEWRLKNYEIKNPQRYAAQIMNKPIGSLNTQLTVDRLKSMIVRPADVPWDLRFSIHCDTAFKTAEGGKRGSTTVLELWGHHLKTGTVYFIEGYGDSRWGAEDFMTELLAMLRRLHRNQTIFPEIMGRYPYVVTDEQDMGHHAGSWELALESWCRTTRLPIPNFLILKRAPTKKTSRILSVVPHWLNDRVRLVKDAPSVDLLIDQMAKIETATSVDYADAAADVFDPDVYIPPAPPGTDHQPILRQPTDEILKGGVSTREALRLYDSHDDDPYEPI